MKMPLTMEIRGNSLDDGPGIRTVVFFKGCPLSCIWCHNPESKHAFPELSYDRTACIGCGSCVRVCRTNALDLKNRYFIDRLRCDSCFFCVQACPAKAMTRVGEEMGIDEIVRKAVADKPFYDISGGGMTLSGGEATLCTEWVGLLAKKLREQGISVLLETCGFFDYDLASSALLPYINDIYCDIKIYDRELHRKYCGTYNDIILENFGKMFRDSAKFGYNIMPRVPLIPGITDTDENLTAIADFMARTGVRKTELLPYNPTWYPKNDKLGIETASELEGLRSWQPREKIDAARRLFLNRGIMC